jgi:hypothetical protein
MRRRDDERGDEILWSLKAAPRARLARRSVTAMATTRRIFDITHW